MADEELKRKLETEISRVAERYPEVSFAKLSRIAVHFAKWQAEQDKETIELAEDHAYFAGEANEREKMMKEAVEGTLGYEPHLQRPIIRLESVPDIWDGGCKQVRIVVLKAEEE